MMQLPAGSFNIVAYVNNTVCSVHNNSNYERLIFIA